MSMMRLANFVCSYMESVAAEGGRIVATPKARR